MTPRLLGSAVLAFSCFALGACGDDDDGGGDCANAQMLCADDNTVEIDCSQYDSAPASVKTCIGNATTCDAVNDCFLPSSPRAGTGG
jgi:hypothetical protein